MESWVETPLKQYAWLQSEYCDGGDDCGDVVWMVGNVGWEGLCFAVACCL
jgi:hypothetical protein